MYLYQVTCKIFEKQISEMENLRDEHIRYIESVSSSISYGGLLLNEHNVISAIVYYVASLDYADVLKFIEEDPYYAVYEKVEVKKFIQKKPSIYD